MRVLLRRLLLSSLKLKVEEGIEVLVGKNLHENEVVKDLLVVRKEQVHLLQNENGFSEPPLDSQHHSHIHQVGYGVGKLLETEFQDIQGSVNVLFRLDLVGHWVLNLSLFKVALALFEDVLELGVGG